MIGQILDASAVDAAIGSGVAVAAWLVAASTASSPLYVPALAMSEVRAIRPYALNELYELLEHPSIVRRDLDPPTAELVSRLLERTRTFDVCAGHVVSIATLRGWPVITADAGRLRRIDPDVDVLLI